MIITQTPLRISFAGGGTDFRDFYEREAGAVVSTAIDKYVHVIVKGRLDDLVRVSHGETETAARARELRHDVAREALKAAGIDHGVDIAIMEDVASEAGLGSPSAATVGLLNAIFTWKGECLSPEMLAEKACQIEIDTLGRPVGKQDQYIAAYGGLRHLRFHASGEVEVNRIALDVPARQRLCESVLLFDTGTAGNSAGVLTEQKGNIAAKMAVLTEMRNQADELARHLKLGATASLGTVLREGWIRKKQLASGISNPRIDELYNSAMSAGAIGGKVTGPGGGGFLLICAPPENRAAVRKKLAALRELPITLEPAGSRVILNVRV